MTATSKRRRGRRSSRALRLTFIAFAALLAFAVGGGGLVWASARELPEFGTLKDYRPLVGTRVYGVDGTEVFQFARERRTVVPFGEIPEVMKKAVLASEDAGFYRHEGVNYLAIARCAVKSIIRGQTVCGGSTITQQVVKTFLLSPEKRLSRKVKEVLLARRLEQNLSKDEILYLYLNQIYFGHRRYGVEEAARFYFGKSVRDITLGEAAMLAGVVQSPERLSPMKHPHAAKERQKYVLRRMTEEKFIDEATARAEVARPIPVKRLPEDPPGQWYADAVRRWLDERYGADRVEADGLVVDIAMDPEMQRAAEDALEAQLRVIDHRQGWRGAAHHLDDKQVSAAMPLWRERLQAVEALPGEVLVWDLGRVSADDLEPGSEKADVRKLATVRRLQPDHVYAGLVTAVDAKAATVDLGGARGVIPLTRAAWARRFDPTTATAAPKRMSDVVSRGDIVQVRVLQAGAAPADLARSGKALELALEQTPKVQGALVAIDPRTRGVVALVGGSDFAVSQFNRALQARRQPGSAFKPFVWGAALESRRFTPASILYDTPVPYRDPYTGKDWNPQNFEREEFDGAMLLGAALAHSKNTISVKLLDTLGVEAVASFARRMGIASELPRQLSLALGTGEVSPLELVNAYATIAAHGFRADPLMVLRVRDRKGQVLEEHAPVTPPPLPAGGAAVQTVAAAAGTDAEARPAVAGDEPPADTAPVGAAASAPPPPESGCDPAVASVLTSMMREVVEYGTGTGAKALGRPAAAKTGTAQEHRDAWFVGFTPDLVAGAWVGFDSHDPLGPKETGAAAALPAWLGFMRGAEARRPARDFEVPGTVEYARIDRTSGLLAVDLGSADTITLPFVAGTVPTRTAADAQVQDIPKNFFAQ